VRSAPNYNLGRLVCSTQMILHPGEQRIAGENVEANAAPPFQPGTLYLTNLRLVFEGLYQEQPPGGLLDNLFSGPPPGLVPRTLLDLPLAYISNVVAVPGRGNRHVLRIESGQYPYTFVTPNAQNWAHSIIEARSRAPRPITPTSPGHAPVVVNVQQTPSQPSVFLYCKHCGTLNAAGHVHCTSCGAAL
jgi:hypothetical protein